MNMHRALRDVAALAPVRIDFGGGWTDVPPYPSEQGGCVCNMAISRHAAVTIAPNPSGIAIDAAAEDLALPAAALGRAGLTNVRVTLRNDFPRGAGLGGSSAAGVAVQAALSAWCGESVAPVTLAERSHLVETGELKVPGGSQDHFAAALGGALDLRFGATVTARPITISDELQAAIERRCIVAYTGESRISGDTITAVIDAYRARERRVVDALASMKALAEHMVAALERASLDDLARLVDEHWHFQRALHPRITTHAIDHVLDVAHRAGASGGKALGASGGGSVLVIAAARSAEAVRAAVSAVAEVLPFSVERRGVRAEATDTECTT